MHVTFVAGAFLHPERGDFPGVRRYSTELVTALDRRGIDVRVVTPGSNENTTAAPGNVEVLRLDGNWNRLGRAGNVAQARVLGFARRLALQGKLIEDTDIIHTTIPLLSIDTIRDRKPVVAMAHHVERVRSHRDLMSVPFGNSYGAYTYRRADAVVVPSEATANGLTRRFNVNRHKVQVIYHGVDTSKFFPDEGQKVAEISAPRKILFVGPMSVRKNVLLLMEAFEGLVRAHPRLQLVLVGHGPLDHRVNRIMQHAAHGGKVVRVKHVDDPALRQLYASADVYASPSLDEGFGFSVVEAMACRIPVVVLDTPVSREVVGDAGILVTDTSTDAWTAALSQVLDDPEFAQWLAERGHARATTRFSWARAATEHIQVYRNVMEARSS